MKDMESLPLLKAAQQGDLQAFNQLALAHQEPAFHFACAYLGDDRLADQALGEAFRRVYHDLPRANGLAIESKFKVLLYRHVAVCCQAAASGGAAPARPAGNLFVGRLHELPCDQRLALLLVELAGLSYRDIAQVIGKPPAAVRSFIAQARRSLLVAH